MTRLSKFELQRKWHGKSERIKCVDAHPNDPLLLTSHYNGQVSLWNSETQSLVKSFDVCELPVRSVKFFAKQPWFACGSDDYMIRVYNYHTHERVTVFKAHNDYIRVILVHPTKPWILSASDDLTIKLWDAEKKWSLVRTFQGHSHYVMSLSFNPKDTNTFASASLDRSIKIWNVNTGTLNYTLDGHEKGVCAVAYSLSADKPYLVSGGDDKLIKIWDYQNKHCVRTLFGHMHNLTSLAFHPTVPVLLSSAEDDTVRVWNVQTWKQERSVSFGMDRVWCLSVSPVSGLVAVGTDKGLVVSSLGQEGPLLCMDGAGKIIWAKETQIYQALLKDCSVVDGQPILLSGKEFGQCDILPARLFFSPNGRYVVVLGENEYLFYSSLAWRHKSFGNGIDLVFSSDSQFHAVLTNTCKVEIFKNFESTSTLDGVSELYGPASPLLVVLQDDLLSFYMWDSVVLIRRMQVSGVKQLVWNERGDSVAIITDQDGTFVLRYHQDRVLSLLQSGRLPSDDGFEEAFDLVSELSDTDAVTSACWITPECLAFTTALNKLSYWLSCSSGQPSLQSFSIATLDRSLTILTFLPKINRLFLADKDNTFISYSIPLPLIEYQQAVLSIPASPDADTELLGMLKDIQFSNEKDQFTFSLFLEKLAYYKCAFHFSLDFEHRFKLAVALNDPFLAERVLEESGSFNDNSSFSVLSTGFKSNLSGKWLQLVELAISHGQLELVKKCYQKAGRADLLFLISALTKDTNLLTSMAQSNTIPSNLNFLAAILTKNNPLALSLLLEQKKYPEAYLFAKAAGLPFTFLYMDKWKAHITQGASSIQEDVLTTQMENLTTQEHILNSSPHSSSFKPSPSLSRQATTTKTSFVSEQKLSQVTDVTMPSPAVDWMDEPNEDLEKLPVNQDLQNLEMSQTPGNANAASFENTYTLHDVSRKSEMQSRPQNISQDIPMQKEALHRNIFPPSFPSNLSAVPPKKISLLDDDITETFIQKSSQSGKNSLVEASGNLRKPNNVLTSNGLDTYMDDNLVGTFELNDSLSMEVNTTGTGSVKDQDEWDEEVSSSQGQFDQINFDKVNWNIGVPRQQHPINDYNEQMPSFGWNDGVNDGVNLQGNMQTLDLDTDEQVEAYPGYAHLNSSLLAENWDKSSTWNASSTEGLIKGQKLSSTWNDVVDSSEEPEQDVMDDSFSNVASIHNPSSSTKMPQFNQTVANSGFKPAIAAVPSFSISSKPSASGHSAMKLGGLRANTGNAVPQKSPSKED